MNGERFPKKVKGTRRKGRSYSARTAETIREMVQEEFRLDLLLETAKMHRSTYYYQVRQLAKPDKDKAIKTEIQAIYNEHKGNYGYRRIYLELRNRGFVINHKKVQRLMTVMGLTARIRRKRLTKVRLARNLRTSFNVNLKVLTPSRR